MSTNRMRQLADAARLLLKPNPLMPVPISVRRAATRNLSKRRFQYGRTLAAAARMTGCAVKVDAVARHFPDLTDGGYGRLLELSPAIAGPVEQMLEPTPCAMEAV
jgi:hypothetical protein